MRQGVPSKMKSVNEGTGEQYFSQDRGEVLYILY